MNHDGHRVAGGQTICDSALFPPFVTPMGAPRNFTGAEVRLRALPLRRACVVNKILGALERREQYRQAVLTVERGSMASQACDRCRSTAGERTFTGCYFTSASPKCAECIRNGNACVGAIRKSSQSFSLTILTTS